MGKAIDRRYGVRKTTEQFIVEARRVHGDEYDYSKTEYRGYKVDVEIICKVHGSFWQRPDVHTSQFSGCPRCVGRGDMSTEERFWAKVNKNGPIIDGMDTACWVWTAGTQPTGYGSFRGDGENLTSHIYSYELHNGPIEKDRRGHRVHHVLHRCDNRLCVNPDHLFAGNDKDNMEDAAKKGRLPHKLTSKKVRVARNLYATGEYSFAELARKFGVSETAISRAITRKGWAHVEEPQAEYGESP